MVCEDQIAIEEPLLSERRLMSVVATHVLGEYKHEVDFPEHGQFVIIYGPNGIGKTRLLESVEALCNVRVSELLTLPFRTLKLHFSDGASLSATRYEPPMEKLSPDALKQRRAREVADAPPQLTIELIDPKGRRHSWAPNDSSSFELWLQTATSWQPYDQPRGLWRDRADGEVTKLRDLREIYATVWRAERLRLSREQMKSARSSRAPDSEIDESAAAIQEFASTLSVAIIDTKRLSTEQVEADERYYRETAPSRLVPTIERHSQTFKGRLAESLQKNSRLSQQLDSSFPRRMLERSNRTTRGEEAIRAEWEQQKRLRARLTQITDLGIDDELALPQNELNRWQLSMLDLYLADAEEKLSSFSAILERINLLEHIINSRLLRKSLSVTASEGFVVRRRLDDQKLELSALSSGEQHEIILMFELLFNVSPGSMVMIDEPEISLHIGWQQKFVSDVVRIASVVGFQFLIATHSPQIIDRWWRMAKELGPHGSDFLGERSAADAE